MEMGNGGSVGTLRILQAVIDSRAEAEGTGSIEAYGLMGALDEMIPHWRSHLKDGQSPAILARDLRALEEKTRELRKILEQAHGPEVTTNIQVSLDGGKTYDPAPEGVRVSYPRVMVDGEDENGELSFNFTEEGLITDLWVSREDYLDHNLGTESQTIEDIQHRMVDQNP